MRNERPRSWRKPEICVCTYLRPLFFCLVLLIFRRPAKLLVAHQLILVIRLGEAITAVGRQTDRTESPCDEARAGYRRPVCLA